MTAGDRIPHPLCFTSGRDEKSFALVVKDVDWRGIDPSSLAALDLQKVIVRESQASADQESKKRIKPVFRNTGCQISRAGLVSHSLILPLSAAYNPARLRLKESSFLN